MRGFLPFAGPAVIASIAYMDPGNFATNIQGGAQFGYLLLWVVLLANLMAMLFQALSAKLGIVTGRSLAQLCRTHFPRPLVYAMWIASEVAAMATDLAESLGAAIGLSLLFGLPLLIGLLITFALTYAMLLLQGRGFRPLEMLIAAFIGVIAVSYLIELFVAPPDWRVFAFHAVVPQSRRPGQRHAGGRHHRRHGDAARDLPAFQPDPGPHARANRRRAPAHHRLLQPRGACSRSASPALVNMAMLAMAAAVFHQGHADVASIETAYHTLVPLLGVGRGGGVHDLAAGIGAFQLGGRHDGRPDHHAGLRRLPHSAVGAPAGDHGARRGRGRLGVDSTDALVLSQVVLSLVLPVPMIALLVLSGRRDVMGTLRQLARWCSAIAVVAATVVLALNLVLLLQTAGLPVSLPGSN